MDGYFQGFGTDRGLLQPKAIDGFPFVDDHDTFAARCRTGKASLDQVDDYIDYWHRWANPDGRSLHEYLGLDRDSYAVFLSDPNALGGLVALS